MTVKKVNNGWLVLKDGKKVAFFTTEKECKYYIQHADTIRTREALYKAFDDGVLDRISDLAFACEDEFGYEFEYWSDTLEWFQGVCPEITKVEGRNGEVKKLHFTCSDVARGFITFCADGIEVQTFVFG